MYNLENLYNLRKYIVSYYNIIDTINLDENIFSDNGIFDKGSEEVINVISGLMVDMLLNNCFGCVLNDDGDTKSSGGKGKSDILLSNEKYLEVKRIPIGSSVRSKAGNNKYSSLPASEIGLKDVVEYIKDILSRYSDENLKNKQRANYISFYFAVSNNDIVSMSLDEIRQTLYMELLPELNIFEDVFVIFNRRSNIEELSQVHNGRTICLSLKWGNFLSLDFNTNKAKFIKHKNLIEDSINDEIVSEDIINYIQLLLNDSMYINIFSLENLEGPMMGVCLYKFGDSEVYVYGNMNYCGFLCSGKIFTHDVEYFERSKESIQNSDIDNYILHFKN